MKFAMTVSECTREEMEAFVQALKTKDIPHTVTVNRPIPAAALIQETPKEPIHQPQPNFNNPVSEQMPITPATHPSTQSQPIVNTTDINLDVAGLPWDERIHSGKASDAKHARNADGKWKKRKGVQTPTIEAVEAELRARSGQSAPMQQPAFNQQPQQQLNNGYVQQQPNFNSAENIHADIPDHMRPQPNFNAVPQQQPPQLLGQPGEISYASVMQRVNNATAAGKIDGMYLHGLCSRLSHAHGTSIASITDLMNRPVLIQAANDMMTADNLGI